MNTHRRRGDLLDEVVQRRINSLSTSPIKGDFDKAHLQAVHRFLFEAWKHMGKDIQAGKFRPESNFNKHVTVRDDGLKSALAIYSRMDRAALERIDSTLRGWTKLQNKNTNEFARELSERFCTLDYIHPFNDGNGRALLAFMGMVSRSYGHEFKIGMILNDKKVYDRFSVARNLSALDRAAHQIVMESAFTGDNLKKYEKYLSTFINKGEDRLAATQAARGKIISEVKGQMNHPVLSRLYNDQYKFKHFPRIQQIFEQALKVGEQKKEILGHVQDRER